MLTGHQVRQTCELLGWTRYDLHRFTALPLVVIDRVMGSKARIDSTLAREIIVKEALHRAGVEFIPENGGGAGVRLRKAERGE